MHSLHHTSKKPIKAVGVFQKRSLLLHMFKDNELFIFIYRRATVWLIDMKTFVRSHCLFMHCIHWTNEFIWWFVNGNGWKIDNLNERHTPLMEVARTQKNTCNSVAVMYYKELFRPLTYVSVALTIYNINDIIFKGPRLALAILVFL